MYLRMHPHTWVLLGAPPCVQVIAADGVTYERQAISEWLAFK